MVSASLAFRCSVVKLRVAEQHLEMYGGCLTTDFLHDHPTWLYLEISHMYTRSSAITDVSVYVVLKF